MKFKTKFIFLVLLSVSYSLKAQYAIGPLFDFSYGYQIPGGDLKDRFGQFSTLSFGYSHRFDKGFKLGVEADFLFGNRVKEQSMFDELVGDNLALIDLNGHFSSMNFNMRGYSIQLMAAKHFPLGKNQLNGVLTKLGVGFVEHKISFDYQVDALPQLYDDYVRGYDRLSNGMLFSSFIGYQYTGEAEYAIFWAGIGFNYANTQNRRVWNFDQYGPDLTKRNDIYTSIKAGIKIPIRSRYADKAKDEFDFQ